MRIIKAGKLIEDDWILLREIKDLPQSPDANIILAYSLWQTDPERWQKRTGALGLCIDGDVVLADIANILEKLSLIALDFPKFVDGRSYSHARLLRERYHYKGELRAVGEVLADQLYFMQRCGIDSFTPAKCMSDSTAKAFSVCYQAASDTVSSVLTLRHSYKSDS